MDEAENFQFNYQKLLTFLSREHQRGYVFARADDYTLIPRINKSLSDDLLVKGIRTSVLYLDPGSDVPLVAQIENASKRAGALIIANLFSIVNAPETGLIHLTQINFAREAFWELNIPLMFWADGESMHLIANHAVDLFSQRRHTTVHFTGTQSQPVVTKLKTDGLETYISSEKFKETQTDIAILERRLKDAENSGYHRRRIAAEIALPLAKLYAELNLADEAKGLLDKYANELNVEDDDNLLAETAKVYYLLHDYEKAIEKLERANKIIEARHIGKEKTDLYPEAWFTNLIDLADWQIELGHLELMISPLMAADSLLARASQLTNGLKHGASRIKDRLAEIMLVSGNVQIAHKYFEESLRIAEQLSKSNPLSEELQRHLSVRYNKIGEIETALGNLQTARKYFEDALVTMEQLTKANPHSEQLQRDLSVSYNKLGEIERASGKLQAAHKHFENSLKIREQLGKNNPISEQLKRDLSISYEKLGNIEKTLGNLQSARKYFEDSLMIAEQLSNGNPLSEKLKRDLSICYDKRGQIEHALGNLQTARKYFNDGLKIIEQVNENNPHSEQGQRGLSVSYIKLGIIEKALGNLQTARKYFEDGLRIREQLSKSNPLSEQLQRDLSLSYGRIAGIEQDADQAIVNYNKSLAIIQRLIANNPLSKQLKDDLLFYEWKIQEMNEKLKSVK